MFRRSFVWFLGLLPFVRLSSSPDPEIQRLVNRLNGLADEYQARIPSYLAAGEQFKTNPTDANADTYYEAWWTWQKVSHDWQEVWTTEFGKVVRPQLGISNDLLAPGAWKAWVEAEPGLLKRYGIRQCRAYGAARDSNEHFVAMQRSCTERKTAPRIAERISGLTPGLLG